MTLSTGTDRDAWIADMAKAGQHLALQWGHQPWSDSWATTVAETMLDTIAPTDDDYVRGAMRGTEFVPDPPVLACVPDGDWELVGSAVDLALAQGSTVGFPSVSSAAQIRRVDQESDDVFVTAEAWRAVDPEYRP